MRWHLLAAVVFGLSISDVASQAQGPPAAGSPASSRATPQHAGYFAPTGVVRFQLIQGRLGLDPPRHRKGSQNRTDEGVHESISVTSERGIPSLHYVLQTPDQHLTLNVKEAYHVTIETFFPQSGERSVLSQPEVGAVSWTTTRGDLVDHHQGATLLHVRQADPVTFDMHLGSLLTRLLQGTSLERLCERTRVAMLHRAENPSQPDVTSILEAVDQLRSGRSAVRAAAQSRLHSWGTPIVPVIQRIEPDRLDAEQRDRLRQVLARLRRPVPDTPATLAMLLINDSTYWSLIAARMNDSEIDSVNRYLVSHGLDAAVPTARPLAPRIAAKPDSP